MKILDSQIRAAMRGIIYCLFIQFNVVNMHVVDGQERSARSTTFAFVFYSCYQTKLRSFYVPAGVSLFLCWWSCQQGNDQADLRLTRVTKKSANVPGDVGFQNFRKIFALRRDCQYMFLLLCESVCLFEKKLFVNPLLTHGAVLYAYRLQLRVLRTFFPQNYSIKRRGESDTGRA